MAAFEDRPEEELPELEPGTDAIRLPPWLRYALYATLSATAGSTATVLAMEDFAERRLRAAEYQAAQEHAEQKQRRQELVKTLSNTKAEFDAWARRERDRLRREQGQLKKDRAALEKERALCAEDDIGRACILQGLETLDAAQRTFLEGLLGSTDPTIMNILDMHPAISDAKKEGLRRRILRIIFEDLRSILAEKQGGLTATFPSNERTAPYKKDGTAAGTIVINGQKSPFWVSIDFDPPHVVTWRRGGKILQEDLPAFDGTEWVANVPRMAFETLLPRWAESVGLFRESPVDRAKRILQIK